MLYRFDAVIHALPPQAAAGPALRLGDSHYCTLSVPPASLSASLPLSFEASVFELQKLVGLDVEPDGFFTWRQQPHTQVEGHLYDRHDRLLYVNLKGTCKPESLDQLLCATGWPSAELMFQLVREGAWLSEPEFRRYAEDRGRGTAV